MTVTLLVWFCCGIIFIIAEGLSETVRAASHKSRTFRFLEAALVAPILAVWLVIFFVRTRLLKDK